MVIWLKLLVALIGLFAYALAQGKAAEVGRIMFWVGLLSFLLNLPNSSIAFLR